MKVAHDKTITTKPWYDGTVYKCGLCHKKFKDNDSVKFHLRVGHKKKAYSYKDIIVSSQSLYMCKLCGAAVTRNRQAIRNHVRSTHKLTFMAYERSCEANGTVSKERCL